MAAADPYFTLSRVWDRVEKESMRTDALEKHHGVLKEQIAGEGGVVKAMHELRREVGNLRKILLGFAFTVAASTLVVAGSIIAQFAHP